MFATEKLLPVAQGAIGNAHAVGEVLIGHAALMGPVAEVGDAGAHDAFALALAALLGQAALAEALLSDAEPAAEWRTNAGGTGGP